MVERPHINRDLSDIERRLAGAIWIGRVYDVLYDPPRARVLYGADDAVTNWLPWVALRAQNDRTWHPPEIDEQVIVICPSGDLSQGVILGALYRADQPAPGDRASIRRTVYDDGTIEEYDRAANHWLLDMTANGGTMEIKTGSTQVLIQPDAIYLRADVIHENDDR